MYTKKYDWFKNQDYPDKSRISIISGGIWNNFNKVSKAVVVLQGYNFKQKVVNIILYSRAFLSKEL